MHEEGVLFHSSYDLFIMPGILGVAMEETKKKEGSRLIFT